MKYGAKEQVEANVEGKKPRASTALGYTFENALHDWVDMQEAYNSLVDSAKSRNN